MSGKPNSRGKANSRNNLARKTSYSNSTRARHNQAGFIRQEHEMYNDFKDQFSSEEIVQQQIMLQRASTSTKKGRSAVNANHLLNFSYRPLDKEPSHRSSSRSFYRPYKKERFLQAQHRFVLGGTVESLRQDNQSAIVHTKSAEAKVDWDDVVEIISPTQHEKCPICLEKPVAPQILKCGHAYCWACVFQYSTYTEPPLKCPVCNNWFMLEELRSFRSDNNPQPQPGDMVEMTLLVRPRQSLVVRKVAEYDTGEFTPSGLVLYSLDHPHAHFNRVCMATDMEFTVDREAAELSEALQVARSSRDPSARFYEKAWSALEAKRTKRQRKRADIDATAAVIPRKTNRNTANDNTGSSGSNELVYFYQASTGQYIFPHPLVHSALSSQYGASSNFPSTIKGAVVDLESQEINEVTRKRYKFLQHLPLTCQIRFCIIDLDEKTLDKQHLKTYWNNVNKRKRRLEKREKEEDKKLEERAQRDLAEKLQTIEMTGGWEGTQNLMAQSVYGPIIDKPPDPTALNHFPALSPKKKTPAPAARPKQSKRTAAPTWPKKGTRQTGYTQKMGINWAAKPTRKGRKKVLFSTSNGPTL